MAAVLGVENSKEAGDSSVNADLNLESDFDIERTTETCALPPVSKQVYPIEELEKLDLDQVSDFPRKKRRDMLR